MCIHSHSVKNSFVAVLVMVSNAVKKTSWPKSTCGGEGVFLLQFGIRHLWKSGQEPGIRNGSRDIESEAYWPAPHGLLSLLSYTVQSRMPRGGTIHSELGSPTSIAKKMPHRLAHRPVQ